MAASEAAAAAEGENGDGDEDEEALKRLEELVTELHRFRDNLPKKPRDPHSDPDGDLGDPAGDPADPEALARQVEATLRLMDQVTVSPGRRAWALLLRAQALGVTPQGLPLAEQALGRALKLNPALSRAWTRLGELRWQRGDLQGALLCFRGALQHGEDAEAHRLLSMALRAGGAARGGDNDGDNMAALRESRQQAEAAVRCDPTDGNNWYVLGNAYVSLFFGGGQNPQDAQRALGAYAQAERVDPKAANNPDLHLNRATLLQYQESFGAALDGLSRAAALAPGWAEPRRRHAHLLDFLERLRAALANRGVLCLPGAAPGGAEPPAGTGSGRSLGGKRGQRRAPPPASRSQSRAGAEWAGPVHPEPPGACPTGAGRGRGGRGRGRGHCVQRGARVGGWGGGGAVGAQPPPDPAPAPAPGTGPGFAAPPHTHLPDAMHGRLKLRPPDASHLLKRQHKLRLFLENMAALRDKRSRGELDADLLEVTGSILAANPETGTAWSLRRRLLGTLGHQWQEEELRFVSACLSRSPKSYGCWQHRGWVLGQTDAKAPAISTGMLDSDPRNFHAWEHRWALEADPDPEVELGFTGTLLGRDFSNFSAWNHRLRILRRTPGSPGRGGAIPPERLRQELELVQNAVFTDPNDQSAWVYLRCLLSRGPTPPRIIWVHVNLEDATVAVTFSRPLWVGEGLTLTLDGSAQEGAWRSGEGRPRPSHTWLFDLPPSLAPPPSHILVTWAPDPAPRQLKLRPGETEAWWQEPVASRDLFWPEVGVADPELLQEVVGTCRELLELEPKSRGADVTSSAGVGGAGDGAGSERERTAGGPQKHGGAEEAEGSGLVTQRGHDPAGVPTPPPPGGAGSPWKPDRRRLRPHPIGRLPPAAPHPIGRHAIGRRP
ncbi:tetratricopeptide repeat protein 5 isoform X3 [Columba livia]|uniref:tetratricopeptide repeat protein 5 isoform X3 n=1 Tax=Columba livia TaxID=8932 RepID=UPI0031BBC4E4